MTRAEIEHLRAQGLSFAKIAARAGTTRQNVHQVLNYKPSFGKRGRPKGSKSKSETKRCPRCGDVVRRDQCVGGYCFTCTKDATYLRNAKRQLAALTIEEAEEHTNQKITRFQQLISMCEQALEHKKGAKK